MTRILSLSEIKHGYISASLSLCNQNDWIWRFSLKKNMIGACKTNWNNVFREILNHSYVTCQDLTVSENVIWLWAKQWKSKVAMQCKTIYNLYISLYLERIQTFEWHNDPLSKMCACVYIAVFYWRQSTQQGRQWELSIKLGLHCDWSVIQWLSHRCRVERSLPFKFYIYFLCWCILGMNAL